MDDKLYIKKFIRDDGEKLSFDGEQLYLAQENTLLVRPDPSTTAVNFTEADGGEMIRQQNTTYDQPVNGLIIPKSTDYWTLTKQLSLFFKVNHTYKIIYVKKDGSMFKVSNAWISSGLQIVPVPHEEYSSWSITMTIGNVNWTEYAEDSQGDEIYSNTITLPLISAATGGEEWEYEEQEEISGEGSEIIFNDTVDGAKITDLTLKGDTFQQTYSGKNLINNSETTYGYSNIGSQYVTITSLPTGLTFTNTYTGTGSPIVIFKVFDGTLYAGKTIRLKANFDVANSVYRIIRMDSNAGDRTVLAASYESGKEISFTIPDDLGSTNYFGFGFGSSARTTVNYTNLIMTVDNADMTYEPYVGEVASPNPDYPQAVQVVTDTQTVKVSGKNLIDNSNLDYDYTNGIPSSTTLTTTPTGIRYDYTGQGNPVVVFKVLDLNNYAGKTFRMSSTFTGQGIRMQICNSDVSVRSHVAQTTTSGETISWTAPNDISTLGDNHYLAFQLRGVGQGTADFNDLIMTVDDSDMAYVPYQSQSYTVDLGSTELCKIGTYQDYIYKSGDDWYVHKEVKKVVLSGNENVGVNSTGTTNWYYAITNGYDNAAANSIISSHYIYNGSITASNTIQGASITSGGTIRVRFEPEDTAANYKTWLTSNNVTIYYALAAPTDTKITDNTLIGELEALYAAQGYNDKTIITVSATGTNLPAILAVTLQNPPVTGEVWDEVGTVWELGSGGTQTVNIDSTTTVYPVWKVEGPCVNPTLQNNTTDTIAQYNGTVAAGQTLTVNFEEGTAYLDSALVTRYVTGLVSLRPGENTIGFNSDGGDTETSTISWNNVIN